jgi:2-polyprenyl-6-methoxyphenol hydroxylase-like FAD-dependent oxidoreductase
MPVVLIIGGGIAGTAAALALDKAAIAATVYEAHPVTSHDRGAFLTLASNGMHALRQIDADTVVCAVSAPLRTMRVCTDQGHEIATVALGETHDPATGYRYLTRAALCSALQREAQDRGICIEWGKRLTQVSAHRRGVTAIFSDGSRACGDVLIGADGLHSLVQTLLNPTASAPRYAAERVFYGYSTNTGVGSPPDRFEVIRGSAAFGYIVTEQNDTWWFCRVADTELSRQEITSGTTAGWKAALLTQLRNDQTPAAGIVRAAHQVLVTNAYDLPHLRTWHRDHMLLIGDAAHAASPATGQGASMALEDAVILAKSLRDRPDPASAFVTYEQLRRDRVQANITRSARIGADRDTAETSNDRLLAAPGTHRRCRGCWSAGLAGRGCRRCRVRGVAGVDGLCLV